MASLTTGLIENTGVSGVRPCSTLLLRISNPDLASATIRISGDYWTGSIRKDYVLDVLTLAPGEVVNNHYYAKFDLFEFRFITSSDAVEISVWSEDDVGGLIAVHNLLPAGLFPTGMQGKGAEVPKMTVTAHKQIYVLNSNSNLISVIDGKTHGFIGNIIAGSGPYGVVVNPVTNRVYVANFGSNNVSAICGNSNKVIATITVGINPVGVGVNLETNKIYVTNWGSHSVSVIDGFTHVVVATISVGNSPEGVNVNSDTNLIYITNHGSNNVSVINGRTNSVISTVEIG